jgi:hypothetical protein
MNWEDYSATARLNLSKESPARIVDILRRDAEREAREKLKVAQERNAVNPNPKNDLELLKWFSSIRSGCYEIPLGPIPLGPLPKEVE